MGVEQEFTSQLFVSPRRIEENSLFSYLYDMHYTTEGSLHNLFNFLFSNQMVRKLQYLFSIQRRK